MKRVTDDYEQGKGEEQEQTQPRRTKEENGGNDDDGGGGGVKKEGGNDVDRKQEEEKESKKEEEESKKEEEEEKKEGEEEEESSNEKQAKQDGRSSNEKQETVVLTTTTTADISNDNDKQQPGPDPEQKERDEQQNEKSVVLLKDEEEEEIENVDKNNVNKGIQPDPELANQKQHFEQDEDNKRIFLDPERQRTFDEVVNIQTNVYDADEEGNYVKDIEDNNDEGDEETGHPDEDEDNNDDHHDKNKNKKDYANDEKNSDDGSYEMNKKKDDGDGVNVTPTEIAMHGSSSAVIKRRKAGGSDKQPTTSSHTTIDGQQYEPVTAATTVSKQSKLSSSSSSIRRLSWTRVLLFLFCLDCCVILPLHNIYLAWKQATYHIPESTLATKTTTTKKEATQKTAAAASIHEADAADASSYGLWNKIGSSFLLKGLSRSSKQSKNKQQIAVFISGAQLQQFLLQSTVEKFLKPLVGQGHAVDFYFSFSTVQTYTPTKSHLDEITSYNSADTDSTRLSLGERVHWDSWLSNYTILTDSTTESKKFQALMERRIRQSLSREGAVVRHITFSDNDADVLDRLQRDKQLKRHRIAVAKLNEKGDPDLRFPLKATAQTNRQLLRNAFARAELWNILKKAEKTLAGATTASSKSSYYDYVIFLKENTLWLQDFDFNKVILKPQQEREEKNMKPFDAFALNCDTVGDHNDDGHSWSMASPLELSDAILIMKRSNDAAKYYGDYYSELFLDNYKNCASAVVAAGDRRGLCTEAMLLHYNLVKHRKLNVQLLNSAHLPLQRALNIMVREEECEAESNNSTTKEQQPQEPKARLKLKGGVLTLQTCLHQVCQSREEPLDLSGYPTCK